MTERPADDDQPPPTDSGVGLPEDAPPGMGVDPKRHPENRVGDDEAPDTSGPHDGDAGQATGNPRAAGGD